jgi:hypothetical protein
LGGWSGPTFWDGAARISYSFLAGLLIYRSNWIIKNRMGFIGLAILLFLVFNSILEMELGIRTFDRAILLSTADCLRRRSYIGTWLEKVLCLFRQDLLPIIHDALRRVMDVRQLLHKS